MRSKQYGNVVATELAKRLPNPELTLDAEKPTPACFTATALIPHDPAGGWSKVEAEIILPPDLMTELARHKYQDIARMLAERCTLDVLELLLLGDTASEDTYLATLDGAVKLGAKAGHAEFSDNSLLEIGGAKGGQLTIKATLHIRVRWPAAEAKAA